jgi:gluconolactonase
MPIEILSDAMKRIVTSQEDPEQLAEGFGGEKGPAEGPVWIREGGYLLFHDIHNSRRMRWEPGKGVSVDKEGTDNANGMTRDRQGRLVACHHLTRCVEREEDDGSVTVVAATYHGHRLNRTNDVVVKSDGAVYFTDPPPRPPITPPDHMSELDFAGVYRVSPDLRHVNLVAADFVYPNGLAFSPDERTLYVNDTSRYRKHIRAFDVEPSTGMLERGSGREFCDMKGDDRPGFPDGMKVDVEGNVYCTGPGGIWVLSPEGEHIGTILTQAINMAWGDDDWSTLYFTSRSTLNRIRLAIPGIPVPRGDLAAGD